MTRLIRLPKRRPTVTHRADGQSLPVASNAISRLEYDADARELTVTFARDGSQYTIAGITELEAYRWAHSGSPGKYFNANIRGKY
jgi:hypothetical protein